MLLKRLSARRQWVTKTDLSRWYRCPYAFWLLETGQITFEEAISPFQLALIHAGQEYEELVDQSATPIVLSPEALPRLLRTEVTLLNTPLFENSKLKLRGCPDGIDSASGALYPVEIKAHRAATRLDGLELAFYWLLLEPQRTRQVDPAGVLILRRDGKPARVEMPITRAMLDTVTKMISQIRDARRTGVQPRVCGCVVCSQLRRDEVVSSVTKRRDVSMITGIGHVYGRALEASGYRTWDALIDADPTVVAEAVAAQGARGCGPSRVEAWQLHARAIASGSPAFRDGAVWPVGGPFIALDLEYDVTPDNDHIWLTGAAVADADDIEHFSWWADTPEQIARAMNGLRELLARHRHMPVVTWAGQGADIPRINAACARLGLQEPAAEITRRHFDAYLWALNNVRLPILSLGLKEVSRYFGFRPATDVRDGLEAVTQYFGWLRTGDESTRTRLIDYNRDDLEALVLIADRLTDPSPAATVTYHR